MHNIHNMYLTIIQRIFRKEKPPFIFFFKKRWVILQSPIPSLPPLLKKWISSVFCDRRLWSNDVVHGKWLIEAINAELLQGDCMGSGGGRGGWRLCEMQFKLKALQDMVLLIYSLLKTFVLFSSLILSFLLSNGYKSYRGRKVLSLHRLFISFVSTSFFPNTLICIYWLHSLLRSSESMICSQCSISLFLKCISGFLIKNPVPPTPPSPHCH